MTLRVNNKLWLVSDTHFGHHNIVQYQQRPGTHEVIMLSEWIRRVRPADQILHLGDVALGRHGNAERWLDVLALLPGKKYLILGNHDDPDKRDYGRAGFTIVPEPLFAELRGQCLVFTHRPYTEPGDYWDVNLHGHVHGNAYMPHHDGAPVVGRRYINLSVEATGFTPVQLGTALGSHTLDWQASGEATTREEAPNESL